MYLRRPVYALTGVLALLTIGATVVVADPVAPSACHYNCAGGSPTSTVASSTWSRGTWTKGTWRSTAPVSTSYGRPTTTSAGTPTTTSAGTPTTTPTGRPTTTTTAGTPSTTSAATPTTSSAAPVGGQHDYVQDFSTAVSAWPGNGGAPAGYGASGVNTAGFCTYADGTSSKYYPSQVLSVHDGMLDYYNHDSKAAAVLPFCYTGFTYGTYTVRMKLSTGGYPGYHNAFLLWPNSNQWTAETDYPESNTSDTNPYLAVYQGNGTFLPAQTTHTPSAWTDGSWHDYTIQWGPGFQRFYQDGKLLSTVTGNIPNYAMHPVLQNEWAGSSNSPPPASNSGHTYIDRISYDASYTVAPANFG